MQPQPLPLPQSRPQSDGEHRWPVALAITAAIAFQLLTPPQLAFSPNWLLPALEGALLVCLLIANPYRINRESSALRALSLAVVGVATLALIWSAARLVVVLVGPAHAPAAKVLISGAVIWLTNVVVFALWFWEADRGGPAARANGRRDRPGFLFAQMTLPEPVCPGWEASFVDYLYLAFTNSTAFSPTDTLPLARWAKLAMMVQSALSLLIVALVIARAVNALG
jgi:uncharacterized membrane protein